MFFLNIKIYLYIIFKSKEKINNIIKESKIGKSLKIKMLVIILKYKYIIKFFILNRLGIIN